MSSQFILKSQSDIKIKEDIYKAIVNLENENQEKINKSKIKIEQKKAYSMIKKDILINLLDKDYLKNNVSINNVNIINYRKCYLFIVKLYFINNLEDLDYLKK